LATVLHAEIAESAVLLDEIGPERWAAALSDVLQILESTIHRYGGEIHERREDGLVALFGVPAAHEDDAERAILAALDAQEQVAAHATPDLALCLGVDSGELLITHAGDRRQAVGRALTLARRAKANADAGTVLVGENAFRLVRALFEWERTGEGAARGLIRLLARKALRTKGRGIEGLGSPLVGRDSEFRTVSEAVERLRAGVGGIVTLVGEAGIGKSRLVAELRAQYPPSSVCWVEGRCLSYGGSIAYLPWQDVLRGLLEVRADVPPHTARDALPTRVRTRVQALCPKHAGEVAPYLVRLMALPLAEEDQHALRGLDGQSLQYLTFRAVEMLVENAAHEQPLVVVCEDLHWADPTSVALLEQLLAVTDRAPLLLICVFRPETAHPCWQIKETAARRYRHRHTDLWLDPLGAAEGETLVENLLRVSSLPPGLRQRILDHAEGNPFYVEEIIRSLIDGAADGGAGIVYDESTDRWRATQTVNDIALPDTLHGVLAARIDRLPEEAKRVLLLASVIGRIFYHRVLAEIAGEEPELDDRLLTLQREQMIRERARVPELEYSFKHHLTQAAAYDGLLHGERRAIHRRVAEALEKLYPEQVEEQVGLLAHHWERAGDVERAVPCLRRAGERAAAQNANAEAAHYLSRALALVPEDAAQRYSLLLARAEVYQTLGAQETLAEDLSVLETLAEVLDGPSGTRRRAQVAFCQSRYLYLTVSDTNLPAAIAAVQKAIRLAQVGGEVDIEAEAYYLWGQIHWWHGRSTAAQPHLQRALALARTAGLRELEVHCLRELGNALSMQGRLAEGKAHLEQSLRISREIGDRASEGWAYQHIGLIVYGQGDYVQARALFECEPPIFREIGYRLGQGWAADVCGRISFALGNYAGARAWFEEFVQIGRELSHRQMESEGLALLSLVFHRLGDDRAAEKYGQEALQIAQEIDLPVSLGYALTAMGHALAGLEQWDRAAGAYQRFLDILRERGQLDWAVLCLSGLADVALAQGNAKQAQAYAEEVLSYLETNPALYCTDELNPHLRAIDEPLWIYWVCYRVLQASGDPRARELLSAGHAMLQERAAKIDDPATRRSFLENVVEHREISAAWQTALDP
jgi:tetratricopeptide (TPR) repeat protein